MTLRSGNRDAAKTQALVDAGASYAASPAALVNACDTTIVMLLNDAALQAVYGGNNGLLMSSLSGKLIIDMSTVLPETMISIGTAIIEAGGQFVECPVSGTVRPARDGKLFGLVGGDAEAVARAHPLLEQLCRRIEHVGDLGAGATVKLAVESAAAGLFASTRQVASTMPILETACRQSDRHPVRHAGNSAGYEDARTRYPAPFDWWASRRCAILGRRRQERSDHRRRIRCNARRRASRCSQGSGDVCRRRGCRSRRERCYQHHPCPLGTAQIQALPLIQKRPANRRATLPVA